MRQWWTVPGPGGGIDELREVDQPTADPSGVIVQVEASGINRGALIGRAQLVSSNPRARPAPAGIEFAGIIVEAGHEVRDWAAGDAVMGRGSACHADLVSSDAAALMAIPSGLSFAEAAAIPNVFVTAHDAIVTAARLQPGESVMVTAGSSGVGTAALQIARHLGAQHVIATTRSPAKTDALVSLGATDVIDTTAQDWSGQLRERTGKVDVVIDQVGGSLFAPALSTMGVGGRFVTVGRNDGAAGTIDLDLVARLRLSVIGVTFRTRTPAQTLECSTRFATDLLAGFDDGSLHPVLDKSFSLDELPKAYGYMRSNAQVGKIVLVR
jgi:NADPH2:quinone reductase